MSVRSLNGLSNDTTNVYINTNLSATLPIVETQTNFNSPITISMKGLTGLGTAGQYIKMNSGATGLEYGDADPSFIRIADETIGSNTYGILYDPTYPKSLGNAYLKYHTNGTDLRLNTRLGTSTGIHLDYGNSNVFSFLSGGTMKVKNSGQSQYEFTYPNQSGTIALTSGIPTQYWTFSNTNTGVVYPTSTAYSVLIGTSTPSSSTYSLETSKSILCGDKLDVLDDLTVSNIWRVEYSSPYTYFYDPTNYSSSNPYNQYHTNGTFYLSNLPVNSGTGSNFKWYVANTTQLMNLDATGALTVFGTDAAEIKIMNDGNTNDVSILNFTNNSSPDFYKFEFKNSANTFTLWNYTNPVFNHDAVNDIFTIEADLTVKNNIYNTSAIDIKCSNASGAKSILDFSIAGVGMKFQYIYDLNSDSFLLKNIAGTTLTSINTFNEFTTSMKTTIQNQLILTGSAPQISNGTYTYTLPSSSGTLLTNNDVTGEWEEFNSVTLKPENTSIEAILVKNGIEFYDSYTNPTEGYQILVNHTDNTFKITNLANNKNIFTFDNDTDIITSTMKHSISNQLVLTGSAPQLSDGTRTFTLPSTTGTLLTNNDIGTGEWTTFDTNTLKPIDASVHSLMIKNAVEFYDDYTTPTAGYQILVNHSNTSFKITNKAETSDLFSFTTTDDIINVGSLVDIKTGVDYTTTAVNAMIIDGDCVFTASYNKNDPIKIAMDNSSFNYQGIAFYATKANAESASSRLAYLESHKTTGELNLRAGAANIIESNGGSYYIKLDATGFTGSHTTYNSSDDRIKFDEELITNATDSIMKLRPQIYNKQFEMGTEDKKDREYNLDRIKEAGLIAQEVYYEAPEFRHLVVANSDDIQELDENVDFEDIQNDINYEAFGWNKKVKAGIKYHEFIPYLIKMNQEQQEHIEGLKGIINKLVNAPSFKNFKETIA